MSCSPTHDLAQQDPVHPAIGQQSESRSSRSPCFTVCDRLPPSSEPLAEIRSGARWVHRSHAGHRDPVRELIDAHQRLVMD